MSSNQAVASRLPLPNSSRNVAPVSGEASVPIGRRQQRKLERRRRFKDRKRKDNDSGSVSPTSQVPDVRVITALRVVEATGSHKRDMDRSRLNRDAAPPAKRARKSSKTEAKRTTSANVRVAQVDMMTISKEFVAQQPLLQWNGSVKILNTLAEMKKAVQEILGSNCKHLGMDTETKPVFRRGDYNPTALIQLATETDVYLFRICKLPDYSCAPLLPLLTNPDILKTGVAIHGDVQALQKQVNFCPAGFVDCSEASFHTLRIRNRGLAALTAHFLHGRLCKRQQMSNWALEPNLSPQQIQYAATDAWVSRQVHIRVMEAVAAASKAKV